MTCAHLSRGLQQSSFDSSNQRHTPFHGRPGSTCSAFNTSQRSQGSDALDVSGQISSKSNVRESANHGQRAQSAERRLRLCVKLKYDMIS